VSDSETITLSIVMPCLNEADTVEVCVQKARAFLARNNLHGEVIVADNGSSDGSQVLAKKQGARVVSVSEKGYGSALMGGILESRGEFIIMADSDDSYDLLNLEPFYEKLKEGFDLVVGNRFHGSIQPGAMPFLHRYVGNPFLTFLGRLFFGSKIGDFHCGIRGFRKTVILSLGLTTTGMEFASELIVKATLYKLAIAEVPANLSVDGRNRAPHLRTWRDGWRHLRFLLIYSPKWLFFYPGLFMIIMGAVCIVLLAFGQLKIGNVVYDIHTLLYAAFTVLIGFQLAFFYLFSREYAINTGLLPRPEKREKVFYLFSLEKGLLLGIILFFLSVYGTGYSLFLWANKSFGPLLPGQLMRIVIPAALCMGLSIQLCFGCFFLSILQIRKK
jgi:glycosyltransferase involved in cell wall biosynthesis